MSLKETYQKNNAGVTITFCVYTCDGCSIDIHESHPHYCKSSEHYCFDCAFIRGYIDEETFLSTCGVYLSNMRAAVIDGEIILWNGKKAPWERTDEEKGDS